MKLELKHIVGYLPYGLKMHFIDGNEYHIEELTGLGEDVMIIEGESEWISESEYKPILRPLSDLTKEIEVNGENFVPLLKICKFLNIHYTSHSLLDRYSIDLVLSTEYHRANTKTKQPQKIRFWFSNFNGTSFYCTNMNKLMYKDLYGAIQKLYEWHFDLHGLIEKGLAIDINTIKTN